MNSASSVCCDNSVIHISLLMFTDVTELTELSELAELTDATTIIYHIWQKTNWIKNELVLILIQYIICQNSNIPNHFTINEIYHFF